MCVYSVTHFHSFAEVNSLHDHILRVKDSEEVPFVLVGNKVSYLFLGIRARWISYHLQCDLEQSREVPKEKGEELAKKLKCKFLESSAKDRVNVTESFYELVKEIKQYRTIHTPKEELEQRRTRKSKCNLL